MGLIKTALYAGAGLAAIKTVTKSATEAHKDSKNSSNSQNDPRNHGNNHSAYSATNQQQYAQQSQNAGFGRDGPPTYQQTSTREFLADGQDQS